VQAAAELIITAQLALAGAVLAAGGAAFANIPLGMLRHAYPTRSIRPVAWGPVHLALVMLLYISVASILVGFAGTDMDFATAILVTVATQAVTVAAILYWVQKNDPHGAVGLGLRRGGNLRALWFGGLTGLMCFPAIWGTNILWPWLFERCGGSFEPQALVAGFEQASGVGLAFSLLMAVLVIPFFEELVFRGFLQSLLVQRMGERSGLIVTAAVFGLVHGPSAFLPIFALALVLGVVMMRTGRIVGPWALHGLYNGGVLVMQLIVGGMNGATP
jgi:membrane protease YdiL (CAAX protease family)